MKNRIFLLCEPKHANLGDQAQLMCTLNWLRDNYPNYRVVHFGYMFGVFDFSLHSRISDICSILKYFWIKLTIRKGDIFIGHSGYLFVDHHTGWLTYAFILRYFPKHMMVILPQTINFYSPVAKKLAMEAFGSKPNLILLCRDKESFARAKSMFGNTRLLLFPDIVTSLIGTMTFNGQRAGILLCARNDIESLYGKEELCRFLDRFDCCRKEVTDTTICVTKEELKNDRDKLIMETIKYFSTFKVVITDRYHGTIFSAIAGTPVVVINSADHKLSSGVEWFPKEVFGDQIQFANELDDAYVIVDKVLHSDKIKYNCPPYFREKYWSKLKNIISTK